MQIRKAMASQVLPLKQYITELNIRAVFSNLSTGNAHHKRNGMTFFVTPVSFCQKSNIKVCNPSERDEGQGVLLGTHMVPILS